MKVQMPSPRNHLRASLKLLDSIASEAGGHPHYPVVRGLLDRPQDLPDQVSPKDSAMKYDVYRAQSPAGARWGVTLNDRFEHRTLNSAFLEALDRLPGDYALNDILAQRGSLSEHSMVVGIGFDRVDQPPRVKIYLQEESWGAGVTGNTQAARIIDALAPGCRLPGWVEGRSVGVLSLTLSALGERSARVYLGGLSPLEAAEGAPPEALALARAMELASPMPGGWYYLTLRLASDGAHRYAINKIYNTVEIGFRGAPLAAGEAWEDVRRLFDRANHGPTLDALRRMLGELPDLIVLPTATALEGDADSTDLYMAAWERAHSPD